MKEYGTQADRHRAEARGGSAAPTLPPAAPSIEAPKQARQVERPVEVTRAVVLAGGLGTRMRPYTAVLPKPLLPLGDKPVLDIVLRQLKAAGFNRVTISTGYLAEVIEALFKSGSNYDLDIDYVREPQPLGTVGSLALLGDLDSPFLVMNGDVVTDLSYRDLVERHVASGAAATIATTHQHVQVSLGVLQFDDAADDGRLTGYVEKPRYEYEASMGVYCFSPNVLEYLRPGERLDFPDLVLRLLAAGQEVRACRTDAYWLDIGRHEDYERACEAFEALRDRLLPDDPAPDPCRAERVVSHVQAPARARLPVRS